MTRPLKKNGMAELGSLMRRTKAQYALGRITEGDMRDILSHARAIEARITSMREEDERGREVQIG